MESVWGTNAQLHFARALPRCVNVAPLRQSLRRDYAIVRPNSSLGARVRSETRACGPRMELAFGAVGINDGCV